MPASLDGGAHPLAVSPRCRWRRPITLSLLLLLLRLQQRQFSFPPGDGSKRNGLNRGWGCCGWSNRGDPEEIAELVGSKQHHRPEQENTRGCTRLVGCPGSSCGDFGLPSLPFSRKTRHSLRDLKKRLLRASLRLKLRVSDLRLPPSNATKRTAGRCGAGEKSKNNRVRETACARSRQRDPNV